MNVPEEYKGVVIAKPGETVVFGGAKQTINRICKHKQQRLGEIFPGTGLGDYVSNALSAIGITKEKWNELRNKSKDEVCNCSGRQALLNWFGSKLGLPVGKSDVVEELIELEKVPPTEVYGCTIHEKCLPELEVQSSALPIIKSKGYHPCEHCEDFIPDKSTYR